MHEEIKDEQTQDKQNAKTSKIYMQLNSLKQNADDPSILDALFIIHDFETSWHGQIITKEICDDNKDRLVNKPIVCKYITREENDGFDALTDHEEFIDTDRNTGEEFIATDTVAIGTFTDVYIGDFTDENNETKEVLYGKAVLWFEKYRNICLLLDEWISNDIVIPTSIEYMYYNYNVLEGIEYVQSPIIYLAHALLNAEDRGDYEQVYPAYDSSRLISMNMLEKWNKEVAQAINKKGGESKEQCSKDIEGVDNNNRKEGCNMEIFKKVCEISKGDLKWKIFEALAKVMNAEEYNSMWISDYDLYDTYFVYESWNGNDYEYYKVDYSKDDEANSVTVDFESKTKVERNIKWEEVKNQLSEKTKDVIARETEIAEKDGIIETLKAEKEDLSIKFNDATGTITALNEKLGELKEIEEEYNKEKFEQQLNARKEEFEGKFKGLNAIDKYNTEEVQELIVKSIEDNDSLIALNSMLVGLIPEVEEKDDDNDRSVKDFNNKEIKNLTPKDESFDARYLV